MNRGYRILPPVYDRWQRTYGKDFSEMILPRLTGALRTHRIAGPTMVDVACGTGSLALLMARRGWQVVGVDASAGMLACAREKWGGTNLPVTFLHQDMKELRLPCQVRLATSFFDSLNHLLLPDDLLVTFRRVHGALAPGGWFVFDMNNELCFTMLWTKSETISHDDFVMTLDNSYDRQKQVAVCRVTLTMKEAKDEVHLEETVAERYYPAAVVQAMLEEAGFTVRESDDFNFTSNPDVGRIKTWWVAEKRSGEISRSV